MTTKSQWCFALLGVLALSVALKAEAQQAKDAQKVVWQIGEFDQTSREFGHDFNLDDENLKPIFTIGESKIEIGQRRKPRGWMAPANGSSCAP